MFGWPMLEAPAATPQPTEPEPDAATGEPTEPAPTERLSLSLGQRMRLQAPDPATIDPIQQELEAYYQEWAAELAGSLARADDTEYGRLTEAALAALALWLRGSWKSITGAMAAWARTKAKRRWRRWARRSKRRMATWRLADPRPARGHRGAAGDFAQGAGAYPSLDVRLRKAGSVHRAGGDVRGGCGR
jgi:hypothetical protein